MTASAADTTSAPVSILLVDDEPANLLALEAILHDLGQHLVTARSGDDALRSLFRDDFAVVLLDVQMQGLDGFETARLIRGRPRSRHTPIIFLTAYDHSDATLAQAYALGAVDFLVKPLVPVILRAKVAVFVELFQQTRQVERQAQRLRQLERQAFEQQLAATARAEEERFRLVVENVRDYAIVLLAADGTVVSWNAGAERILGYRADEIIGRPDTRFFTPEAAAAGRPQRELRQAAEAGRADNECWLVRKDGSRFWASGVTTALRDGELRGFVKILRDLTERKALEDELRQRAAALAEANRHKDEFLAMLAHELRNPLAPVLTGVHVARQAGADSQARAAALEMVERQARHLGRLVDDLLDVSRLARGRVQLRPERLDLARLVRTTAEDRRGGLEQAGLALAVATPETPVWVQGDPTRLVQVIQNLLDNAAKFTDRGGRVDVGVAVDETQQAVVTVRDTGVGIAADQLQRLWEAFAQADRSLDRARGGLGLGLAVVRGLVELHGGRVQAASAGPGRGAEFTVRLPAVPEPTPLTASAPAPASGRTGERLRVLIVEDNRDAADSLKLLLEIQGHQTKVAATGPEGVRVAKDWAPDIVLCDLGLPELDGYGVARQLRLDRTTARARLVALTGYGSDEDRRRSRQAGFDYHLTKPADPEALLRLLVPPA
jgi:PAS domain S-box-containing protein